MFQIIDKKDLLIRVNTREEYVKIINFLLAIKPKFHWFCSKRSIKEVSPAQYPLILIINYEGIENTIDWGHPEGIFFKNKFIYSVREFIEAINQEPKIIPEVVQNLFEYLE